MFNVFFKIIALKQIYFILALGILSCKNPSEKKSVNSTVPDTTISKIKLHPLRKLFIAGDFDGDGKQDSIYQHNFSKLSKSEIEYSADPFYNDWDTVVQWFYKQDANLYLSLNKKPTDTLNLGIAQGLYCLINIGDNNADGKDEIALVIDYLDYSRLNYCKIYSLCKNKWKLLKQFEVPEASFDYTSDKAPIFDSITDYLEKQNGKWVYNDFSMQGYNNQKDLSKMLVLKIDKCQKN